jgi:gas vesicle protein
MNLKDLQDLINRETMKKESGKTAQKFAVGIGLVAAAGLAAGIVFALKLSKETRKEINKKAADTVGNIKNTVLKDTEAVKDSAEQTSEDVNGTINEIHATTENVGKDIQKGSHAVTEDIHKTAEDISGDLHKSRK